ncbi:cobalamin B12-binding domain-containing protein [Marivita hallyeonensis]|uniref:Methanogenic corrinoid protein MtbC1 n=1 Tax=Marivita hallyeonensis TaxID=996342 RepID=A0A1M5TBZ0_9RHOB|nr:cobalamin-dependent protein [Marivita hallyeonensis]SHH48130.1 Methanogenic corrinoid protein MtbC1 [Marivita hallyeonensis]
MVSADKPILIRAVDEDPHGKDARLSDAALLVFAQEVIQRLSVIANDAAVGSVVDVDSFCFALIEPTAQNAKMMLLKAHENGASHRDLCVDYIAAAARRLGEWWDDDIITFGDMAVAAGRMLHFLRDLREFVPVVPQRGSREALFTTVPGEQHILGVTMAADIMRDHGWKIDLQINQPIETLCEVVRNNNYMIIGLSATNAERVRSLAATIVELRLAAPHARIFIGGHIVQVEPDIAVRTGADAAADDVDYCVEALERLYQSLPVIKD